MGTYSWYITSRNNADTCKINWKSINTDILYKSTVLQSCYEEAHKYPTLQKVAERFDETKLMGYLTHDFIMALMELSNNLIPNGSFPRIYYEYEGSDTLWCLEFIPGKRVVHMQTCDYKISETHADKKKFLSELPENGVWET